MICRFNISWEVKDIVNNDKHQQLLAEFKSTSTAQIDFTDVLFVGQEVFVYGCWPNNTVQIFQTASDQSRACGLRNDHGFMAWVPRTMSFGVFFVVRTFSYRVNWWCKLVLDGVSHEILGFSSRELAYLSTEESIIYRCSSTYP